MQTAIKDSLRETLDLKMFYSVRSSTNVENTSLFSFAGQFKTFLNVKGLDSLVEGIENIWRSSQSDQVSSYQKNLGHKQQNLKVGIIIQEMVTPLFSGVVFTRNPITGSDESIIETVDGYGDLLVQKGFTPDRWVFKWSKLVEHPEEEKKARVSTITRIMEESTRIERKGDSY